MSGGTRNIWTLQNGCTCVQERSVEQEQQEPHGPPYLTSTCVTSVITNTRSVNYTTGAGDLYRQPYLIAYTPIVTTTDITKAMRGGINLTVNVTSASVLGERQKS